MPRARVFYFSRAEQVILYVLLAALACGAGVLTYAKGREAGSGRGAAILEEAPTRSATSIAVEVSGAVSRPGVYRVPGDARVGDVIAVAGGLAATADTEGMNMAARVQDEEKVTVPGRASDLTAPARAASAGRRAPRIISLNAATEEELESLPGIGEVYAKRIIEYREEKKRERGRGFESTDELLNVTGIGPRRLAALRSLVRP